MSNKLYVLALLNKEHGWELEARDVLAWRACPDYFSIVVNVGGPRGCPKFNIARDYLATFIEQMHAKEERIAVEFPKNDMELIDPYLEVETEESGGMGQLILVQMGQLQWPTSRRSQR